MNAQAPSTTTVHRGPIHALLAGFTALVLAGATTGVIAITSNDDSTSSSTPSVTGIAPQRVLDGSPILRGRVAATAATQASSVQGTPHRLAGRPMGFGYVP